MTDSRTKTSSSPTQTPNSITLTNSQKFILDNLTKTYQFEIVNLKPKILPPTARFIDEYSSVSVLDSIAVKPVPIKECIQHDSKKPGKKRTSAHPSYEVKHETQFNDPEASSHFKFNASKNGAELTTLPDTPIWELEAGSMGIARWITRKQFTKYYPIFDKDENGDPKSIGVASDSFPNFVSAKEDPLKDEDMDIKLIRSLIIEAKDEQREHCIAELLSKLTTLSKSWDQHLKPTQSGLVSNAFKMVQNNCNYYLNFSTTAIQTKTYIDNYLKEPDKFKPQILISLLTTLNARLAHVKDQVKIDKNYESEITWLTQAIDNANYLKGHPVKYIINEEIHRKFREVDKIMKDKKVEITNNNLDKVETLLISGESFAFTMRELKIFRIHSGNGRGLTTAVEPQKDTDRHLGNFTKYGDEIDGDHMDDDELFYHKPTNKYTDWFFRKPTAETFVYDAEDVRNAPILKKAKPFLHPTIKTSLPEEVIKKISLPFNFKANFITQQTVDTYSKFSASLLYNFEQYLIRLTTLLMDREIVANIWGLSLRKEWYRIKNSNDTMTSYLDNAPTTTNSMRLKGKNLLEVMVENKLARIEQMKNVLTKMPEFRDFLFYNGEYAFELIMDQVKQMRAEYFADNLKHPNEHYRNLIAICDNEKAFRAKYEELRDLVMSLAETKKDNLAENPVIENNQQPSMTLTNH